MKNYRNIFNDQHLTKEELKNYLDGSLSEEEKLIIEQKMASSDFSMEALEGFESDPDAMTAFEELSDQFHGNLSRKANPGKWRFEYSFIVIIVLALATYGIGHYFLLESEKKRIAFDERRKEEKTAIAEEKKQEILEEKNIPPVIELADEEIDSALTLPTEKQLLSEHIITEAPLKIELVTDSNFTEETHPVKLVKDSIAKAESIKPEDVSTEKFVVCNVKTLFLSKLLVVDYTDEYTKGIEKKSLELTGTSADLENNESINRDDLSVSTYSKEIAYVDYLRDAQDKFYHNKFKAALKDYKVILEQFPDDLNAHFYSGLCYYNINRLHKAIEHFDRVIEHPYNVFEQEGNWYKALSYFELGETSACITLLNKIANGNGVYASKASALLEKI